MSINNKFISIFIVAFALVGCASSQETGNVESLTAPSSESEVATTSENQEPENIPQASQTLEENEPKTINSSPSGMTMTPQQLNRRAKYFTVRIDGASNGSGVIIDESDNTYTVLTNWHVVLKPGQYTIQTADGREHQVDYRQVERLAEVDLALVKFNSEQNYQIAEAGDSDYLSEGQGVHLAGYPGVKTNNDRIYRFYNLNIVSLLDTPIQQGYSVLYEGETIAGMSGSPLLNSEGNLVGIHGMYRVDDPTIKQGSSYAIPINTYKELVAEATESTKEVASEPSLVATKENTEPTDNPSIVQEKQADNIIAHQEDQTSGVIATQPGPKSIQVELIGTKVTGQILTVTVRYISSNKKTSSIVYPIRDVSYIEDDTAKKYTILKDESELYLASPKIGPDSNERINFIVKSDPVIVWFKFPAPSPETQTISINIPEVAPFDGVPVQR